VNPYSRQDVLRILRITSRQLSSWERAGLIAFASDYGFDDLIQLRKLRDLRAQRISASNIKASVHAMRAVSGIPNPLLQASIALRGPRLVFRHSGTTMDPIAGQFELDFEGSGSRLEIVDDGAVSETQRQNKINSLFFEGVRCEEQGKVDEAAKLYEETLSLGEHAPAAINLGTILYNKRQFERAEQLYRRASIANPDYALAFFDLGNALDELQRLPEAVEAYKSAIRLSPGYADAHYNLALAYERSNERRRALRHWIAYVKLDPVGPWSNHARLQVRKILDREELAIVWRRPKTALTAK